MTNEEKARKIACDNTYDVDVYDDVKAAALEMAEWKDQQFKEYLEKKREDGSIDLDPASELIYEIISELFGETENVDHSNNNE